MSDTVRVRVLVVIDSDGEWGACGWKNAQWGDLIQCADGLNGGQENHFWVTAELAIPKEATEAKGEPTVHLSQVTPEESTA